MWINDFCLDTEAGGQEEISIRGRQSDRPTRDPVTRRCGKESWENVKNRLTLLSSVVHSTILKIHCYCI